MSADENAPVDAPRVADSPQLWAHLADDKEPTGDRYWQYTGDGSRVYTHIPVTIQTHEMIKWPEIPAEDGCWREATFDATSSAGWTLKAPDNAAPAEPAAMISPAATTEE